jgi:hypothetical protein
MIIKAEMLSIIFNFMDVFCVNTRKKQVDCLLFTDKLDL